MAAASFDVLIDARVKKDLRRAPFHVLTRFSQALPGLREDPIRPRPGMDIVHMHGGTYRLRIGPWRVHYQVNLEERIVRITRTGPRSTVYR